MTDIRFDDLLLLHHEMDINDEELLMLTDRERRRQLAPDGPRFDFNSLDEDQCVSMFRFEKSDLRRLTYALRIPEKVVCPNNTSSYGLDALCITLRRLAYPNRLADLVPIFGRSESELSLIFNTTINFLYDNYEQRLTCLNQRWLQPDKLQEYADAVHCVAPLCNCWGFIDGTLRPISRPFTLQEMVYSGHKRTHGIKFQSVLVPNGMIANFFGPLEGKRHGAALLRESGILTQLENQMNAQDGDPFCLYGDGAYPLHTHLLSPFKGMLLNQAERDFNREMSSARQSVEWGFWKIVQNFAFLDFKKNMKLLLQPVARYYTVGCFLTNCHTCLYGSTTGVYFGIEPPTLDLTGT